MQLSASYREKLCRWLYKSPTLYILDLANSPKTPVHLSSSPILGLCFKNLPMNLKNYMAFSNSLFSLLLLLLISLPSHSSDLDFIYHGFNDTKTEPSLTLNGFATRRSSGALQLTNKTKNAIGRGFYPDALQVFHELPERNSSNFSFSTQFVFAIVPSKEGAGHGFVFVLGPSKDYPDAEPGHYLGILNSSNRGNQSNHIFAVEFDTKNGLEEDTDTVANEVGININSVISNNSKIAGYTVEGTDRTEPIILDDKSPIQAWIEYDAATKSVDVTIAPIDKAKPSKPLATVANINLSEILTQNVYVGFSAANGDFSSSHYILGWSFRVNGVARELNLSLLPLAPIDKEGSRGFKLQVEVLIGVLCAVVLFLLGLLFFYTVYRKIKHYEDLEDWELDCPHRFRYKDLHMATKGFKESEVIGSGGFGKVYKGILPTTGEEVAVKKIAENSVQGTREFAAEIESLGRLRHRHLVNLQGWCKRKTNLLLVYEYIPNGSLDSLLYKPKNNLVLNWEQRFVILKDVASGLLYLHEDWEKVVIHRDIKSSNVLIDATMNARLGDFGLARLHGHDQNSHTTDVVGTIGYIAPELARTGKASSSSDVFAYGILLLEIACGRRPIDPNSQSGHMILMDWVTHCYQMGRILDVVDPELKSKYVAEDMKLVLGLGLLCSHQSPESRPSMRQVLRYLNRDEPIPIVDDFGYSGTKKMNEMSAKFLEVITSDESSQSYNGLSVEFVSSTSLGSGR